MLVDCGTRLAGWPIRLPLNAVSFRILDLQQQPPEIDQVHAIELHGCEHSARHRKKVVLQVNDDPTPWACGIDANFIKALLRQSGDLETALPGCLREGFPLSIETVIENCGIFPATAADTAAVEASRICERNCFPSLRHKNCRSLTKVWTLPKPTWTGVLGWVSWKSSDHWTEVRRRRAGHANCVPGQSQS